MNESDANRPSLLQRSLQNQRDGLRAERDRLRGRIRELEATIAAPRRKLGVIERLLKIVRLGRTEEPSAFAIEAQTALPEHSVPSKDSTRPSIAVITDTLDWSFGNIARVIELSLSDDFDITIISTADLEDNAVLAFYLAKDHDIIHFLWRESIFESRHYFEDSVRLYFGSDESFNEAVSDKTTFTVYDHLFLGASQIDDRRAMFEQHAISYAVCSERLASIYSDISAYPKPSMVLQDGVDCELFKSSNLERFDQLSGRSLVIGWVGNSAWANDILADSKGFHTILLPAIERLSACGWLIKGEYADRQAGMIPRRQMPAYYAQIDVLVCVSDIEGTPNPVLEAMACGVPVISTDVGIVPEAFGPQQRAFILKERSVACLEAAILSILEKPSILRALSQENIEKIRDWRWETRIEAFRSFFWNSLEQSKMRKSRLGGHE